MSVQSLKCSGLTRADGSAPTLLTSWNHPNESGETTRPMFKMEMMSFPKGTRSLKGVDFAIDLTLQPTVVVFDKVRLM